MFSITGETKYAQPSEKAFAARSEIRLWIGIDCGKGVGRFNQLITWTYP